MSGRVAMGPSVLLCPDAYAAFNMVLIIIMSFVKMSTFLSDKRTVFFLPTWKVVVKAPTTTLWNELSNFVMEFYSFLEMDRYLCTRIPPQCNQIDNDKGAYTSIVLLNNPDYP